MLINTADAKITFNTANVMSLWHTGAGGASATAFLRQDGMAIGATGYKGTTGGYTYLNGAVYLTGGAYSPDGKPLPGGPPPVIIGQEGHFEGKMVTAARIQLNSDWTMHFRDHANTPHTTVSDAGEWRFIRAIESPLDRSGELDPEGRVAAQPGATYHRIGRGDGARFFVKESGEDSHGWVAR